ncbi:MAG: hypothetical protein K2M82_05015 [Lachnospiraceae bacterium]|nr:hypothetical protein [Lachnospiraceae bacterium]
MLFNEKYAISHVNFNTGWIVIDYDGYIPPEWEEDEYYGLNALIRSFAKFMDGEIISLGMMQYKIDNSPFDFVFQWDNEVGIVIVVEDLNKIGQMFNYIKETLAEINVNFGVLYE